MALAASSAPDRASFPFGAPFEGCRRMNHRPAGGIEIFPATAGWATDEDGIRVQGRSAEGPFTVLITRAGLAALVGRDRCELSASMAWTLFERFSAKIAALIEREHAARPASSIRIDYADVERVG
ncbi:MULTISPECIES: hypothetical protein [Sphingomonadales]|nr:hypothetical protein HY78_03815 [Rhizorhabdus wittichii DC-6]